MIDFVAYFSTAQEKLGYIVLEGYGTVAANLSGGPMIARGTYRVEGSALVQIAEEPYQANPNK